jgi:hypothetical protein
MPIILSILHDKEARVVYTTLATIARIAEFYPAQIMKVYGEINQMLIDCLKCQEKKVILLFSSKKWRV